MALSTEHEENKTYVKTDAHRATVYYVTTTTKENNPFSIKVANRIVTGDDGISKPEQKVLTEFQGKFYPHQDAVALHGGIEKFKKIPLKDKPKQKTETVPFNLKEEQVKRAENGEPEMVNKVDYAILPYGENVKVIGGYLRMISCEINQTPMGIKKQSIKLTLHDWAENDVYIVQLGLSKSVVRDLVTQITNIDYSKDPYIKLVAYPAKTYPNSKSTVQWQYKFVVAKDNKSVYWRFVSPGENMPFADIDGNTICPFYNDDDFTRSPELRDKEFKSFNDIKAILALNPSLKQVSPKETQTQNTLESTLYYIKDMEYAWDKNPTTNKPIHENTSDVVFYVTDTNYKAAVTKKYLENQAGKSVQEVVSAMNTTREDTGIPEGTTDEPQNNDDMPF